MILRYITKKEASHGLMYIDFFMKHVILSLIKNNHMKQSFVSGSCDNDSVASHPHKMMCVTPDIRKMKKYGIRSI